MIENKAYKDIEKIRFSAGLHLNLRKLEIVEDVDQCGAGDDVDSPQVERGLVIHGFHHRNLPSDQSQNILAKNEADAAEEDGIPEIHGIAALDPKVAQRLIVNQVLNKAAKNRAFWLELLENGSVALSKFKLSSEAKAAIAAGDVHWVKDNVGDLPERQMAFLYKRLEREAW